MSANTPWTGYVRTRDAKYPARQYARLHRISRLKVVKVLRCAQSPYVHMPTVGAVQLCASKHGEHGITV